jgi:hypothetical protein
VLLLSPARERDPVRGMYVLQPGESFSVVVKVWNRGDRTSEADSLWAGTYRIAIPPLSPGAMIVDTLAFEAPETLDLYTDETTVHASLFYAADQDPLQGNDAASSETFIVAVPAVRATLVFPDTIYSAVPFTATVTLRNISLVPLPGHVLTFCMFDFDIGCGVSDVGTPFHLEQVPIIPPGGTWTRTLTVTMPASATGDYADFSWRLAACFGRVEATIEELTDWHNRNCVPDYIDIVTREVKP